MSDYVNELREGLGVEDLPFLFSDGAGEKARSQAAYLAEVNDARREADVLSWDGLIFEVANRAVGETEPTLKAHALEELAGIALAALDSLERQVEKFNEEDETEDGDAA